MLEDTYPNSIWHLSTYQFLVPKWRTPIPYPKSAIVSWLKFHLENDADLGRSHQALALLEMAAKEEAKPAKQGRNDWCFLLGNGNSKHCNHQKYRRTGIWPTNIVIQLSRIVTWLTRSFNRPKLANRRGKWGHHWFISLEIAAPINKNREISNQNVAGNLVHKQTIPKKPHNFGIAASIIED